MDFHRKLEMNGLDSRVHGSSLRFWETQYETDDWGPSINAGHAWTLWSAHAHREIAMAIGSFPNLWKAWEMTNCVFAKWQADGSFPPCWTPEPLPAIPHDDTWGNPDKRHEGRSSSASAGERYPECRSVSSLFLNAFASQAWADTIGFDPESGRTINASVTGKTLTPRSILPCRHIILGSPAEGYTVEGLDTKASISVIFGFGVTTNPNSAHFARPRIWQTHAPSGSIQFP
jgi:hypothetical protein